MGKFKRVFKNQKEGISHFSKMCQNTIYAKHANKTPENNEEIKKNQRINWWLQKPFFNDNHLFNDNDWRHEVEDFFDKKTSTDYKKSDIWYNKEVCKALDKRKSPIGIRGIAESYDNVARCETQFDRQILEDCVLSHNGQIKQIQPVKSGDCNIPSQYQIDKIAKYADITLEDAVHISKMYQYLELGFNTVREYNSLIRYRSEYEPWDIEITDGLTLQQAAQAMKEIPMEDQEAPDWMHIEDDIFDMKHIDDIAAYELNVLDEEEEEFGATNTVGEYTYWNVSKIDRSEHLKSKRTNKQFIEIYRALWNKEFKSEDAKKLGKIVSTLTGAQQDKIRDAYRANYAVMA